ncbi:MAG TPA: hypothetical protein VJH71_01025 [Candidatus Paceibacterota bacterium]
MGLIVKSIFTLIFIAIAGGFVVNHFTDWKQKIIEVVNPSAKETRLLGELKENLDKLDDQLVINNKGSDNTPPDDTTEKLITESKKLVDEINLINNKNSGIVSQAFVKIIETISDKNPFLTPNIVNTKSPPPTPTPLLCPTPLNQ